MPNLEIEKLKPRREICGLPGRPHEVANITVLMRGLGQSSDWLPPIHKVTRQSEDLSTGLVRKLEEKVSTLWSSPYLGDSMWAVSKMESESTLWQSKHLRAPDAALAWTHLIL